MINRLKSLAKLFLGAWTKANERDIGLGAAGVAYFSILSLAPALAALVAVYGLIGDPAIVQQQVAALGRIAPPEVAAIADEELLRLVRTDSSLLAWSGVAALAVAIWSANQGVDGFLRALARVQDGPKQRGYLRQVLMSLSFTFGAIILALLAVIAVAIIPSALALLRLDQAQEVLVRVVRWPILLGAVCLFMAALYRWGPNRPAPRWRAVWPFSALATAVWVAGSLGLSFWASRFSAASATYGSLAGAAGLLLWLYVSAYVFLLGGALADATEHAAAPAQRS